MAQAEKLATASIKSAFGRRSEKAVELRQNVLLTFFTDEDPDVSPDELPKASTIRRLERARNSLKAAYSLLGIPDKISIKPIDTFFDDVLNTANILKNVSSIKDVWEHQDKSLKNEFIKWISLLPRLSLVDQVAGYVNKFNNDEKGIFENVSRYFMILNAFLNDSKKSLGYNTDGNPILMLDGRASEISFLSSGERQLFVLITNLMFNNDEKQANILIIDEPELSLHLKWQEMFVESLHQANPATQLIMATHSPSIILNNENSCLDLS